MLLLPLQLHLAYTQLPAVCCLGRQQPTQDTCHQDTSDAGVCCLCARGLRVCGLLVSICVCVCAATCWQPRPCLLGCCVGGWGGALLLPRRPVCGCGAGWLAGGVCAAGVCASTCVCGCVVCVRAPPMTAAASALPRGLYTTLQTGGMAVSLSPPFCVCACSDLYQCVPQ